MIFFLLSAGADAGAGTPAWVSLAYLIAGVFFILALRGLSSPSTSRTGNRFGMAGMLIAVVTTLVTHEIASLPEILVAIAIGGEVVEVGLPGTSRRNHSQGGQHNRQTRE